MKGKHRKLSEKVLARRKAFALNKSREWWRKYYGLWVFKTFSLKAMNTRCENIRKKVRYKAMYGCGSPRIKNTRYRQRHINKNPRCNWCKKKLTMETSILDHIVPLYKSGDKSFSNTQILCVDCNTVKDRNDRPTHYYPFKKKFDRVL